MRIRAFVLGVVASLTLAAQPPTNLRVLSSNGIRAVVEQVFAEAERAAGRKISIEYDTSSSLRRRIEGGEAFDVALITSDTIAALAAAGKVDAATRADLGRSGIGIGIRSGALKPDIRTPEALKQTLLKAESITYAQDGASRANIERMMERFGIAAEARAKTVLEQGSTRATAAVVEGRVELVLTLASEIIPVKGLDFLGVLPSEFQSEVTIVAGVSAQARNREAALALIRFLASAAVDPALQANGMQRR